MSSPSTDLFVLSEEECGDRLDKLLARHFPGQSRTYFQFLIEQGLVLVNGSPLKKRDKPKPGDEVEICFLLTPEISLEPQDIPLDILYEDEHLLAVNKPAGMVVHPAPGHPSGTFVNALLFHCKRLQVEEGNLRPGIVHRLDKDTSGILLAAKTKEAHQKLVSLFCERKIHKYYRAICIGNPGEGLIEAPIGRHPIQRKQMAVHEKGKPAISRCKVLEKNSSLSLVEVELITGRTHQIRVHLKHRGAPILGDPVYGSAAMNEKFQMTRQLLHAYRVELVHPITGEALQLTAPLPAAFAKIKF